MLFYFAYKTFITTADEIIEEYGISRQHHRFLFFINKLPGITIKELLLTLEISKQGSHGTLRKLKEEGLINDWYAIMEELANYREGFKTVEHLKETDKS